MNESFPDPFRLTLVFLDELLVTRIHADQIEIAVFLYVLGGPSSKICRKTPTAIAAMNLGTDTICPSLATLKLILYNAKFGDAALGDLLPHIRRKDNAALGGVTGIGFGISMDQEFRSAVSVVTIGCEVEAVRHLLVLPCVANGIRAPRNWPRVFQAFFVRVVLRIPFAGITLSNFRVSQGDLPCRLVKDILLVGGHCHRREQCQHGSPDEVIQ
jgi:hypothetical protein